MALGSQSSIGVHPRSVANKSDRRRMIAAIHMALDIQSPTIRRNTQTFNRGRYRGTAALPDYDALKDQARAIKENSLARLPELLTALRAAVERRGGYFYLAADGPDACRYVRETCVRHRATLVVKGKSITTEEIRLNRALEDAGIEVAESDLAEFILQLADEQPSHFLAPALHYSRERITALFKRKFQTDLPLETGEELTRFAREILRQKFLHADVGITGANLIAADTGTLMLVESEGNIRMASVVPPVHIAVSGIEKVSPSRLEMATFLELLAASATGQKLSSYTSFLSPPIDEAPFALPGKPRKPREFHLVLIDNGRLQMRDDPVLREALYCIRCSACLNSCANFQAVGGHAFGGETYSGGIGGSWEAGTSRLENARFSELCTGCSRCVNQCPVRIDIPWLNENLRNRLNREAGMSVLNGAIATLASASEADQQAPAAGLFFGNYHRFAEWGARFSRIANRVGRNRVFRLLLERFVGLDHRRVLPEFPRRTLVAAAARTLPTPTTNPVALVALFADVFTNYGMTSRALATIQVLRALHVDVIVTDSMPEGRAALSQGMIATASEYAQRAASLLDRHVHQGRDVIIVEPSSLAMFRRDARHLLDDHAQFERLRSRTFEPVEYLSQLLSILRRDPQSVFDVQRSPVGRRLFYHAHCQQKTIGAAAATEELLRKVGFEVIPSSVECCGMAGSFGYKRDFYELSMAVGEDLFAQVNAAEQSGGSCALIASGTSCTEQLHAGFRREVLHPMELLAATLRH